MASQNGEVRSPNGAGGSLTASPRPPPTLPAALRATSSHGLGISAEDGRVDAGQASHIELPSPPPLPVRPCSGTGRTLETGQRQQERRSRSGRRRRGQHQHRHGSRGHSHTINLVSQPERTSKPAGSQRTAFSVVASAAAAPSASLRDSPSQLSGPERPPSPSPLRLPPRLPPPQPPTPRVETPLSA